MTTHKEIHPIQGNILKVLVLNPEAKFSEMNSKGVSSDQFTFHIKKLVKDGLVTKIDKGIYKLTAVGKEAANRLDIDGGADVQVERQAKIGVLVVPVREKAGKTEYLVQKRLKQPFYGYHGFLTGKIKIGETTYDTAERELKEEAGLHGMVSLEGVKHKMDYSDEGQLLEDKYFFTFRVDDCVGTLIHEFEGGRNMWLTREQIEKLPDRFDGVFGTLEMIDAPEIQFVEKKYNVTGF